MIPLIIVCGKAGSGKDSFGNRLAEKLGAVSLGLADPMKRMMAELFAFTDTQLYGPSEERNKPDPGLNPFSLIHSSDRFPNGSPGYRISDYGPRWIRELGMNAPKVALDVLSEWFESCRLKAVNDGALSARFVLQTFGTEWGRTLDPEVWSRKAVQTARILLGGEHTYDRKIGLVRVPTMKRPPNIAVITDGRFANEIVNVRSAGGLAVEIRRPDAADTANTGVVGHISEAGLDEVPPHFYDGRLVNDGTLEDLLAAADCFGAEIVRPVMTMRTNRDGIANLGVA